jgi:LysR family hydrogen peroxide-inducible transcriptional activator
MDPLSALAISLRQLQYIVAVAEQGSFRRAAEICHVAQPSLSAQVAVAERALGVQLFERTGRRVRVPAAAAPLVAQARRVLTAAGEMQQLARRRSDPFHGTLRLGVIPTICPYLLPEIARPLARAYPHLTVEWSEERTARLVDQVKDGAIDGAVLALEGDVRRFAHETLASDPFYLAAAPGHPLARGKKPLTPDALDGARVFLLDDGHCFRDQALQLCARAGAREAAFRATSLATLVQMASASGGVTLLPSIAVPVENRRRQLTIRAFAKPGPGRTIVLAWRRGSALHKALVRIAGTIAAAMRKSEGRSSAGL